MFWASVAAVAGVLIGGLLNIISRRALPHLRRLAAADLLPGTPDAPVADRYPYAPVVCFSLALLYAVLTFGVLELGLQSTPEVQPSQAGLRWRLVYHAALIAFLLAATIIDLDCYLIPDFVTVPGFLIGVGMAAALGELQLAHLWVDWNEEIPGIRGPWIPEWLDRFRTLHALAWSLAGAATGAGVTWLVRAASGRALGVEALGFGDVTLMGMAGSYLGWQATLCALLVAPFFGVVHVLAVRSRGRRPLIPFGPSLAAGCVTILFGWGTIWRQTRNLFGDWQGLLILGGTAVAAFLVAMALLRYRGRPAAGG